jgi:hypothetical protein
MVTVALTLVDMFHTASLARAYRVLDHGEEKVYSVRGVLVHQASPELGVFEDSFTRYQEIPTLSLAVKLEIVMLREFHVVGIVKVFTIGTVVSGVPIQSQVIVVFPVLFSLSFICIIQISVHDSHIFGVYVMVSHTTPHVHFVH